MQPQVEKLFTEAMSRQASGDTVGALLVYKRLQRQFPDFADAWVNASWLLCGMSRHEEALATAENAVRLAPDSIAAMYSVARAKMGSGLVEEALDGYKGVIERDACHAPAMADLADALLGKGRFEEARELAARAAEIDAETPRIHYVLGMACKDLQREDEAVTHFREAIRLYPAYYPALSQLSVILARQGEFAEAIELGDRAVEALPSESSNWGNRGHAKLRMLDLDGAQSDFAKALELNPDDRDNHWRMAYLQMLHGRWREAWHGYTLALRQQDYGKPRWNGEPLDGRTLLVHSEQGAGDMIQSSRFVPRLKKQYGGRILLQTLKPLKRLLSQLPGIDGLVAEGEPRPEFDLVVSAMLLPAIMDLGPKDLSPLPPPAIPYHPPLPELARPGFKVGITWVGNPAFSNDSQRSMDPAVFGDLADIQGVAWYGLQKQPSPVPPRLQDYTCMSRYMGDYLDTAQVAKEMDLLVSVDTSMAHLAGFLALPSIVMLAYLPDWRWGLGETTPWYPKTTLIRQPAHGDWPSVMRKLKHEIERRMGKDMEQGAGNRE